MADKVNGLARPEKILDQLEIPDNMRIADFGCGNGFFAIPLGHLVPQGKVYALDVVKETLEAVRSRAQIEGLTNIETIRCNLEVLGGSKLVDESIDMVLLRNILYQSQKKNEIVQEAARVLREKGVLVLIEWVSGSYLAPKEGWFISKEEAQQLVEAEGLSLDRELEIDSQHYGLVFKK